MNINFPLTSHLDSFINNIFVDEGLLFSILKCVIIHGPSPNKYNVNFKFNFQTDEEEKKQNENIQKNKFNFCSNKRFGMKIH